MPISTAPDAVYELIEKFQQDEAHYRSPEYKETSTRQEFIDPLFAALGWDIGNAQGAAAAFRDVVLEYSIKIGDATKAPDYLFQPGGARRFFVEAKKPSVNLRDGLDPAYQLRRYAWTAGLPLSILTDFEEFAIYDCRVAPDKRDKASVARLDYLRYTEYADRWQSIAALWSREAVLSGSLDAFAEANKAPKGALTVDAAFLREIEGWRALLADNIARWNDNLSVRDLNYAVQMTLDRLIFLRICEDRGIESYGMLRERATGGNVYTQLLAQFRDADDRYNSGLFHFHDEKGRAEAADTFTPTLHIDDEPLRKIIRGMYYPDSPYEFSVLPVEILGRVYEQFLGKTIQFSAARTVTVAEKPEVRKAGGVYYTPAYIVEYIVKHTVGALLAGKTPREAAKLRIVDPACGSGSFLLGAYQHLLDWHAAQYVVDPKKHRKELYQAANGAWRLTSAERRRILLANIYGVDIDAQAVEVTKLSLSLKVLEGETEQSIGTTRTMFHERALPDLSNNIKCGNALIGPDFYATPAAAALSDEEQQRVNAFDWQAEFKTIMGAGGFDAVIGNPPYLRIQGLQEYYNYQIPYFANAYKSAVKRFDLYLLFLEKGFTLLNTDGRLGFICPHKFVNSDFGSGLRQFLIAHKAINQLVSFGNNLVFDQASTYTGIIILNNRANDTFAYYEFSDMSASQLPSQLNNLSKANFSDYRFDTLTFLPWTLTSNNIQTLLEKINRQPFKAQDVFDEILVDVQSGIDNVHVLRFIRQVSEEVVCLFSERGTTFVNLELGILKPFLRGEDVHRYEVPITTYYCIYPYKLIDGKTKILEEEEIQKRFPLAYEYLNTYREELRAIRERQKTNIKYWYSCHRSRDMRVFERERIITPEISLGCNMTVALSGIYHNTMVYSIIPSQVRSERLSYWLGLLNSRVLWWFLSNTGNVLRGGYFRFKTNYLLPFPIRTINFDDPGDVQRHDEVVALVERILDLHRRAAAARTPSEQTLIARQIAATDAQIDRAVYALYGLTADEITIVEAATA